MHKRLETPARLALTLAAVVLLATPTLAGLDIDFGAAVSIGGDDDLFFTVAAHYYDDDKEHVRNLGYRYDSHPDDIAVALFIAHRSGKPSAWIYNLRKGGHSWFEIAIRAGLGQDVFFVPVQRHPGPPYGNAYGHWKKHKHDRSHRMALTDADVRNLVAVRMVHEYYGVPVETAMEWRGSGRDVRALMVGEYHGRHGKKRHAATHAKHEKKHVRHQDHDHVKGKGRGKQH